MPKTTAIKASENTIEKILNELPYETTERFIRMTIEDAQTEGTSAYFVTNVKYYGQIYPFLVYSDQGFLEDFASVPPGIDEYFVPVTQVKE
jgi:hypothetical protein